MPVTLPLRDAGGNTELWITPRIALRTGRSGASTRGGGILEVMTTPRNTQRKHLASSPFAPEPEQVVEVFEVGDQVCHDLYGLGKVLRADPHGVTVDFGAQHVRIKPPFAKLQHL